MFHHGPVPVGARSGALLRLCPDDTAVERLLGAARMYVRCEDGKVRLCRVPGGKKRYVWVRENDLVIVSPWDLEGDTKGDVVFKYDRTQEAYLRNKGFLKNL